MAVIFKIPVVVLLLLLFSCKEKESSENIKAIRDAGFTPLETNTKMVFIPGGSYLPFYGSDKKEVAVHPFLLDETPVTNEEFLAFVKANPRWQKSYVKRVFADSNYLRDWPSDLQFPEEQNADAPVCFVSWFAAQAYAQSVKKRLPTLDEWEFVAMADEKDYNARDKKSYSDYIISLYLKKNKQLQPVKNSPPNAWGVYNMFDRIWEWTDDFNAVLTTGDSREGTYDDKDLFCAGAAVNATDILNYAAFMRFGLRTSLKANYTVSNMGFRCAKDTNIITK